MKAMPNKEFEKKMHMIKFERMELYLSPDDGVVGGGVGGVGR